MAARSGTPGPSHGAFGRDRRLTGSDGVRQRDCRRSCGRSRRVWSDRTLWWRLRYRRGHASRGTRRWRPNSVCPRQWCRRAYPPGHAALFETLTKDQLLVSELPPGAHPTRVRFLARNRLIAAMSRGTIVVEAALRSGARNTASWALGCGRPLMAVPGSVYSRASTATHLMIRNGQAVLVTSAADVLELISDMGQAMLPLAQGGTRATDALSETQLAVFEAIPARRRAPAGEIALAANVSVPSCLAALTALES